MKTEYRIVDWGYEVSISEWIFDETDDNVEEDIMTLKHVCTLEEAFEYIREKEESRKINGDVV